MEVDDISSLQLAQIASEFIDDAWSQRFPKVGDWIEVSDITNGDEKSIMIAKISRIFKSQKNSRLIQVNLKTRKNNDISIELYPSQLVSGLYMMGERCFSIAIIDPPDVEDGDGAHGSTPGRRTADQA